MNLKIKSLIAVAAIGMASLGLYSMGGIAANQPNQANLMQLTPPPHVRPVGHYNKGKRCAHAKKMWKKRMMHYKRMRHGPWNLGLKRNKNLTQQDARTLVKAALLMQNRHDLNPGKITSFTNKRGIKVYLVDVVSSQNKLANKVVVNSSRGTIRPFQPKRHMQKLQPPTHGAIDIRPAS